MISPLKVYTYYIYAAYISSVYTAICNPMAASRLCRR